MTLPIKNAIENERKFLVNGLKVEEELTRRGISGKLHTATYFTRPPMPAVRVTFSPTTGKGKFCVKFPEPDPENREEHEHTVPTAQRIVERGPTFLAKVRYDMDGWEIDRFITMPLYLAEWETHEGKQPIPDPLPDWITCEVTDNPDYTNQALAWAHGFRGVR